MQTFPAGKELENLLFLYQLYHEKNPVFRGLRPYKTQPSQQTVSDHYWPTNKTLFE